MRLTTILVGCLLISHSGCIASKLNDRALHPSSIFEMVPEDMDLAYEVLAVESDGVLIHAWFLPAEQPTGDTVVVCGGNTGNKGLYVPLARELTRAGYHTVLIDYRGYGFSTGEPDLWSLVDDTEAVVRAVAARPDTERIGLFGMSLGSVVALGTASRDDTVVAAVISESTLHPREALRDQVGGFVAGAFGWILMPSSWDVVEISEEMPVPIFFIHGGKDSITPRGRAMDIIMAGSEAPAERDAWIIGPAGHTPGIAGLYGEEYIEAIVSFLDCNLRGQGEFTPPDHLRGPGNYRRCRALFEESESDLYRRLGKGVPIYFAGNRGIFTFGVDEDQPAEERLAACREVEAQLLRETPGDPSVAPLYAPIWLALGETWEELGRNEDALRAYRRYLDLVPENPHAFFYFTDAGWDMGWSLNDVADTLQRMAGLAPTEDLKLRYFSESVDWRERALQRGKFMHGWEAGQRRAAGLPMPED